MKKSLAVKSAAMLFPVSILAVTLAATTVLPTRGFGHEAFDRIKSLAGEWVAVEDGRLTDRVISKIRVTAGGHAVLEILFPDTDKEMVTVYHLDGDDLVLQHYCVLGNQPRMVARPGSTGDEIAFDFAGCCNLASDDDKHMHEATITFAGRDRLRTSWQQFENSENNYTVQFDLARRRE